MESGANPHLDANAVHSEEIREDDPRHLGNLTKRMSAMNSQVSADTKYDPQPPPRVDNTGKVIKEQFVSPITEPEDMLDIQKLYIIIGGALIIIVLVSVFFIDPRLRKIFTSYTYGISILLTIIFISLIFIGYSIYNIQQYDLDNINQMAQYTS
jgi:hypothetical protein